MNKILTSLLLCISLCSHAQLAEVYCRIDQDAAQVSWSVINTGTGQVMASGSNQNNAQMVTAAFEMPPGTYQITVTDSGANGWQRGMFMLTLCGMPIFLTLGNFTSQVQATQTYTLEVCPPCAQQQEQQCAGDLNGDGTVGIADMIQMISIFGQSCP
jgi:hypothetical protein